MKFKKNSIFELKIKEIYSRELETKISKKIQKVNLFNLMK
jgi:hypothetical protein